MIRRLTPAWRLRATVAAVALPPLVHLLSLDRIDRWIGRSRRPVADPSVDDLALALWVDRVLSHLPPPWKHTCLKRALVLHYLLQRAGRPAELRIGVRRDAQGTLLAHAWLVRDGQLHLERATEQAADYSVVTTLTASRRGSH